MIRKGRGYSLELVWRIHRMLLYQKTIFVS